MPEPMTNDLRDASPRILRDLRVYISTRIEEVEITQQLTTEEHRANGKNVFRNDKKVERENSGFHEKSVKNQQVNDRDEWRKARDRKYKRSISRGDKGVNLRKK